MILKGNQRGGGGQLAAHLTNTTDNDHVELHEIRGLAAKDVAGAFQEIQSHATGTRCQQPYFSVSLNPPAGFAATIQHYEMALAAIEAKYPALKNQPRVVLFHEKEGRRHCHAVWSRIDTARVKAINLNQTRNRLCEASHAVFLALGLEPPPGLRDRARADPLNYDPAVWQQAKRLGEDPRDLKQIIGQAWQRSDNRASFEQALKEHSLILAQGDRRGFVVIHHTGDALSLTRYADIKAKDARVKLGPHEALPTVAQARAMLKISMAAGPQERLDALRQRQAEQMRPLRDRAAAMKQAHRAERAALEPGPSVQRDGRQALIERQRHERGALQAEIIHIRGLHRDEREAALRGNALVPDPALVAALAAFKAATSKEAPQPDPAPAKAENQKEAARRPDGTRFTDDPAKIIEALTTQHSTFTRADLARFVEKHTTGQDAKAAIERVFAAPELARLGKDAQGRERFTARDLASIEQSMVRNAEALKDRAAHPVSRSTQDRVLRSASVTLSAEQEAAFRHVTGHEGIAAVVGFAGSGKSTMLGTARQAWEAAGYRVQGAALAGVAADGLQAGAGIDSKTIHSRLYDWDKGSDRLTAKDVLVLDEAGMVGSRLMARVLDHAKQAGAKVVLVGDAEQLQAIDAGGAFHAIVERTGSAEISTIRRQREGWQQDATREFATAGTAKALHRYEDAGMVHQHEGQEDAKASLIAAWDKGRQENPDQSQIILSYTRDDVRDLNDRARTIRRAAGELGQDHVLQTSTGKRAFAWNDRLYFLKNDRRMGVRNGSLGTVEAIDGDRLTVRLDGDGRHVTVDIKTYSQIDHGYAATVHKSQGVTVDRTHVLASKFMDRHAAYVGMTRHRERVDMHWSKEEFGSRAALSQRLGRQRAKDTSLDYEGRDGGAGRQNPPSERSARSRNRQPRQPRQSRQDRQQARAEADDRARQQNAQRTLHERERFEASANACRAEAQTNRHADEASLGREHQRERLEMDNQHKADPQKARQQAALDAITARQQRKGMAGFVYRASGRAEQDGTAATAIRATLRNQAQREAERVRALHLKQEGQRRELARVHGEKDSQLERGIAREAGRREAEGWQPQDRPAQGNTEAEKRPVEEAKDFEGSHAPEPTEASHGADAGQGEATPANDAPRPPLTTEERIARREATRAARAERDRTFENDLGRTM